MQPYTQTQKDNIILREFSADVDSDELVWHRDKRDRKIRIIEGVGWQLQFDDEMPITLLEGEEYFIPKNIFHRVIKGENLLKLEIEEICPCETCNCKNKQMEL